MSTIDKSVLAYYEAGKEFHRLRSGIGFIEFERTKELLLKYLPKPPAVIYDIGGLMVNTLGGWRLLGTKFIYLIFRKETSN